MLKGFVAELIPGGGLAAEALDWAASRRQVAYRRGLEQRLGRLEEAVEGQAPDEARVMLVADGWRRARLALYEEHAEAMGRVVAAALNGEEGTDRLTVDRAAILLRLLDDLQAIHLAVLLEVERPYPARSKGLPEGATQQGNRSAEELADVLDRDDVDEIRWVLTDLARHGLVRYSDRSSDGISYNLGPPTADILPLGRDLLAHLPDGTASTPKDA